MNAENFTQLDQEVEKNELLENFQMEELEQRFEMKAWDVSVSAPTMCDAGETIETNTTAVGGSATWTF